MDAPGGTAQGGPEAQVSTIKPKHQRLVLVAIALAALVGAGLLAAWGLRNQANFFYVPAQYVTEKPASDRLIRLGGMVEAGSLETLPDGVTVSFTVGDGKARVPVRYTGILPDLFVEGSGVVAEGRRQADGLFLAENLLAKHDENYMPRELEGMDAEAKADTLADTVE